MSLLDRVREANVHDPAHFIPLDVAGRRVGRVKHDFAARLACFPEVFRVENERVRLAAALDRETTPPAERTEAVNEIVIALRDAGLIRGWRGEMYPVNRRWGERALLALERAAIPFFGVRGYGVHMNGYVRRADGLHMWVARRSRSKPTGPGKLDQVVAGGQPEGLGLRENMIKECAEEAGIARALAEGVRPVGAITYTLETPEGFRPDMIFNFDLELPADFTPVNTDGEVESFHLWPMARVIETVRDGDEFKFNCALVVIDFLIRHGFVGADDPDYAEIVEGLMSRPDASPRAFAGDVRVRESSSGR